MPFRNPVAGGLQLIREALQSFGFQSGVSGWRVERDGDAEFNDAVVRGDFQAGDDSGVKVVINDSGVQVFNLGLLLFEISLSLTTVQALWYTSLGDPAVTINGTGFVETPILQSSFTFDSVSSDPTIAVIPSTAFDSDMPVLMSNGFDTEASRGLHIPAGIIDMRSGTALQANATTTPLKDTEVGDLAFEVKSSARKYLVHYHARCRCAVAGQTMNIEIRDGGAASPTAASTLLTTRSIHLPAAVGAGATHLELNELFDAGNLSVGPHTIAAFYVRTAGGSTVAVDSTRQLWVSDEG